MTSVTVLKDISYGSNAFDSCASLVSVTVEEGVTEIGNYMFQNTKLTSGNAAQFRHEDRTASAFATAARP